jgi:hypothetical protein
MRPDPIAAQRRANFEHLRDRLWTRYNLPLTSHDLLVLTGRIRDHDPTKVKVIAVQPAHEILLVSWLGKWVLLAWHKRYRRIRTFLPLGAEFAEDGTAMYKRDDPPEWVAEIQAYKTSKRTPTGVTARGPIKT